ncbi:hypothetical protein HPB50_005892 [Hyalomma asiaticum]|uniref:Uncharacterized protein n=1 Tax=Hyalomma asiaticum TaxID=266040 RepID=A0ACB7S5A7_HYAAI|nr:hypothetical protein HPB50_005892 [Hyalomma asiaticum]
MAAARHTGVRRRQHNTHEGRRHRRKTPAAHGSQDTRLAHTHAAPSRQGPRRRETAVGGATAERAATDRSGPARGNGLRRWRTSLAGRSGHLTGALPPRPQERDTRSSPPTAFSLSIRSPYNVPFPTDAPSKTPGPSPSPRVGPLNSGFASLSPPLFARLSPPHLFRPRRP